MLISYVTAGIILWIWSLVKCITSNHDQTYVGSLVTSVKTVGASFQVGHHARLRGGSPPAGGLPPRSFAPAEIESEEQTAIVCSIMSMIGTHLILYGVYSF